MPFIVTLVAIAAAADPILHTLHAPGLVSDARAADLDGDGRASIFVLACEEGAGGARRLLWYSPASDGAYPGEPSGALELPVETGGVFFAEYDGEAPREVMLTSGDGVDIRRLTADGALERVAQERFHSLYPARLPRPQFLDAAAADLDADGVDDWFVPKPGGFVLRLGGRTPQFVACDVPGAWSPYGEARHEIRYRFPAVVPFHGREGQPLSLALAGARFVEVAHPPEWRVAARHPVPWRLETAAREARALARGDDLMPRPPDASGDLLVADLNADGWPDLVVTEAQGAMSTEATTRVYFARPGPAYPETPDAVVENAGSYVKPAVVDLDGDGYLDLHFVEIPFGMGFLVNYFVRDRVTMHLKGHLFRDGGYRADPHLTAKLSLGEAQNEEDGAFTHGDFNGDGRMDLALGDGPDSLVFLAGSNDDLVDDDPFARVDVPPYGIARRVALDANGRDDVLLYRPHRPDSSAVYLIRF